MNYPTSYPSFSNFTLTSMLQTPFSNAHDPTQHPVSAVNRIDHSNTHSRRFIQALPLVNKIIIHRVLTAYASRLLKHRIHDSRMTSEIKIEEWYQRHPGAMHSHLGVFPSTFKLVLHDLEI